MGSAPISSCRRTNSRNVSRSFTRQLLTLIGPRMVDEHAERGLSEAERTELDAIRRRLVHAQIAYVHSFRHHLRGQDALGDLRELLPAELLSQLRTELNRPVAISQWMGDQLRALYDRGWIHPQHLPVLEASLTEITTVQGACERIKSTPIPRSYTILIHRIVALYCLGLPFGIVSDVGIMTPTVVAIVAYGDEWTGGEGDGSEAAILERTGRAELMDGPVIDVADQLFNAHLLPFEAASVLLLVAIVGAVALTKRKL